MIIALGHKKRVGKDTVGKMIEKYTKLSTHSFASKLKSVANQLYGWGGLKTEQWYDKHGEDREIILPDIGLSPRTIWIQVGSAMRMIHPDTWIKSMPTDCIVTDLRYPNEFEWANIRIRVDNPRIPDTPDIADDALNSETNWDYILVNDGTLEELEVKVKVMLQELGIV